MKALLVQLLVLLLFGTPASPLVKRQEFAALPWGSPLRGHRMKMVCPMQDEYLEKRNLSSLHLPAWLRTHQEPVGRCPVKYYPVVDEGRIWPPVVLGAQCTCERSRCTRRGFHICMTVYIARRVLRHGIGFTKELFSVDCICAARKAKLIKFAWPRVVIKK